MGNPDQVDGERKEGSATLKETREREAREGGEGEPRRDGCRKKRNAGPAEAGASLQKTRDRPTRAHLHTRPMHTPLPPVHVRMDMHPG